MLNWLSFLHWNIRNEQNNMLSSYCHHPHTHFTTSFFSLNYPHSLSRFYAQKLPLFAWSVLCALQKKRKKGENYDKGKLLEKSQMWRHIKLSFFSSSLFSRYFSRALFHEIFFKCLEGVVVTIIFAQEWGENR